MDGRGVQEASGVALQACFCLPAGMGTLCLEHTLILTLSLQGPIRIFYACSLSTGSPPRQAGGGGCYCMPHNVQVLEVTDPSEQCSLCFPSVLPT